VYAEMEETILSIMAAGIPASLIGISHPSMVYDRESLVQAIKGEISFTGYLM